MQHTTCLTVPCLENMDGSTKVFSHTNHVKEEIRLSFIWYRSNGSTFDGDVARLGTENYCEYICFFVAI